MRFNRAFNLRDGGGRKLHRCPDDRALRPQAALLAGVAGLAGVSVATMAAPLSATAGSPAVAAHIVPYEVRYEISLKDAEERAGIVIADGTLLSRLSGSACAGWSTDSRMAVRFVFRREGERETASHVASWESDDGNQFVSRIERRLNGRVVERIRVAVERPAANQPFRLMMTMPKKQEGTLPAQTLFPTIALKKLLAAAQAGERSLSLLLYEGDEDAAPQRVAVLIGKRRKAAGMADNVQAGQGGSAKATPKPASGDGRQEMKALQGRAYWPVSMAYYGPVRNRDGSKPSEKEREASRAGLPEYEVHFRLYENGITGNATLIYPEYTLRAKVHSIRLLPQEKCD